ncbi:thiol-disulfide oxidoreductase [Geobacter sp. FeAm09]|nr:thiol-disulfide oxidoreductase [Geobacter sp. FeAm09]
MAFVEVPHPLGMIPLEEIRAKADEAFPKIVQAATHWKPLAATAQDLTPPYPAERIKFKGTYEALNKMFYDKHWSIGLPIIPPTPEKVAAMLKGTTHKPDEVVWAVPPRMGQLTVELVAAYGVMAGCKPEHMPLLLAVVKALSHPDYDWRGSTTTTAPTNPVVIINGPILDKLRIGYSTGVLGGEQPVNVAVGYFINLVGDVVGGSTPPAIDKSSQGSRGDLVAVVIGENEKQNPWGQSYAVEQGFKPTDNVVTAYSAYMGSNNVDHTSVKAQELLNTLAAGLAGAATGITSCLTHFDKGYDITNKVKFAFLFLGPEHADTIHKEFQTKKSASEYLVKKTVLPFWMYAPDLCKPPKEFGPYDANTMVPRFTGPEQVRLVVTGGPGKQSQIWPTFTTVTKPVSVLIEN